MPRNIPPTSTPHTKLEMMRDLGLPLRYVWRSLGRGGRVGCLTCSFRCCVSVCDKMTHKTSTSFPCCCGLVCDWLHRFNSFSFRLVRLCARRALTFNRLLTCVLLGTVLPACIPTCPLVFDFEVSAVSANGNARKQDDGDDHANQKPIAVNARHHRIRTTTRT